MSEFVTTKEAAKVLKCSESKLNKGRCLGTLAIPFIKNGNQVLYDKGDLWAWLEQRKHVSTSEYETTPGPGRPRK